MNEDKELRARHPAARVIAAEAKRQALRSERLDAVVACRPAASVLLAKARAAAAASRTADGQMRLPVESAAAAERCTLAEPDPQTQKMEMVGRLASGVAHDFNNELTVILGYCDLLLMDLEAGDPREAQITEIHKAGVRARRLTRQLLAFSRRQVIAPTLLDVNVIVTDMHEMLGRLIGEDVRIVLELGSGLALVKADRGQVEQVVVNLVVNARDAMPTGGTLTIATANVTSDDQHPATPSAGTPGPQVELTVTDTGTGMTPDVQARLFEPFFTTKEAGKGTGLGMSMVQGIVTRHGGSVGVCSEVGKGSSFRVCFPCADASERVT